MHYIYIIQNLVNDKVYVGQTSKENPIKRWKQHKYSLKVNSHSNCHLQSAYNKYGIENFEWFLLDQSEDELLINDLEEVYRLWYYNLNLSYNILKGGKHRSPPEETREKISNALKGKPKSEEARIHIKEAQSTPEIRKEKSDRLKGKPWSEARRQAHKLLAKRYEAFGELKSSYEWSVDHRCSISHGTLWLRFKKGWDIEEAITTPSTRLKKEKPIKPTYIPSPLSEEHKKKISSSLKGKTPKNIALLHSKEVRLKAERTKRERYRNKR